MKLSITKDLKKMKKISLPITIYRLLPAFGLLALTSCVELEEKPESSLTANQFYNSSSDAEAAVNSVYAGLNPNGQSLYRCLLQIGMEMATDDYEAGPRARNAHVRAISNLVHDAGNDRMQEMWKESYDVINRANVAIDNISGNTNIPENLRNRFVNEAKFLRALNYFNLVRWFKEVPIVLHETTSLDASSTYVSQATEDEVYEQIIKDLKDAEALPDRYDDANIGRATSGAAKSLLSKVYLTHKDWKLAAEKSKEVIESGIYDLFEDFADVFNLATENGKEHIFSIQFKGNANYIPNNLSSRSAANEVPGINGDYADALHVEGGLYESYDANDKRLPVTFVTEMVSPTDGKLYKLAVPHFYKYYDETVVGNQGQSSKDVHYIRYAEVLLIYAEALNEAEGKPSAEAYAAIDKVRERAGITLLRNLNPNLSQDEFREYVFEERRKELVFEFQRWFDLARRGSDYYVQKLKASGKTSALPKHIHFPIPQRELDLNPNLHQLNDWK